MGQPPVAAAPEKAETLLLGRREDCPSSTAVLVMRLNRGAYLFIALLAVCAAAVALVYFTPTPVGPVGFPTAAPATPVPGVPAAGPTPPSAPPRPSPPAKAARPHSPTSPAVRQPPAPRLPSLAAIEAEILRLTDLERAAEGLSPLAPDPVLGAVARAHSRDMVARDYFSHENPLGEGPDERAEKAGYDIRRPVEGGVAQGVGENIGQVLIGMVEDIGVVEQEARSIAAAQVRSWMDSRGHRSNILSEEYLRTGVGVAYDGKGMYICTQVFW